MYKSARRGGWVGGAKDSGRKGKWAESGRKVDETTRTRTV